MCAASEAPLDVSGSLSHRRENCSERAKYLLNLLNVNFYKWKACVN